MHYRKKMNEQFIEPNIIIPNISFPYKCKLKCLDIGHFLTDYLSCEHSGEKWHGTEIMMIEKDVFVNTMFRCQFIHTITAIDRDAKLTLRMIYPIGDMTDLAIFHLKKDIPVSINLPIGYSSYRELRFIVEQNTKIEYTYIDILESEITKILIGMMLVEPDHLFLVTGGVMEGFLEGCFSIGENIKG